MGLFGPYLNPAINMGQPQPQQPFGLFGAGSPMNRSQKFGLGIAGLQDALTAFNNGANTSAKTGQPGTAVDDFRARAEAEAQKAALQQAASTGQFDLPTLLKVLDPGTAIALSNAAAPKFTRDEYGNVWQESSGQPPKMVQAGPGKQTSVAPDTTVGLVNPYGGGGGAAQQATPQPQSGGGFDSFYQNFLAPHEGGYTPSDGNGAPANFGINQKSNPDVNVAQLTPDKAQQIMHDRYWTPSGADNLPPALAAIEADTAVNMGVGAAKQLLAQSGGDPQKYLQLRAAKYQAIAAHDPSKAPSLPVWLQRNADLGKYASSLGAAPAPAPPSNGFTPLFQGAPKPREGFRDPTPAERAKYPGVMQMSTLTGKAILAPQGAAAAGDPNAPVPRTAEQAANSANPLDAEAYGLVKGDVAPSQYRSYKTAPQLFQRASKISLALTGKPFDAAGAESQFKFRNSQTYQRYTNNAPVAIQTIVQAAAAAQRLGLTNIRDFNNFSIDMTARGLNPMASDQQVSDATLLNSFLEVNKDDLGLLLGTGTGSDYKTKLAGAIFDPRGAPRSAADLTSAIVNKITDKMATYATSAGIKNPREFARKQAQDLVNGALADGAVDTHGIGNASAPQKGSSQQGKFTEGVTYQDASGHKAKYVGGKWVPVN